jgi:hypothetical protein
MIDSIVQNEIKIQERIREAFQEIGETEKASQDIAFHLTDWMNDLQELVELYSNIDNASSDEITSLAYKFLAHVPNHLNAAMKLSGMGKIEDVFQVGIFKEE